MRPPHDKRASLTATEDGCEENLIVGMGHRAAAAVAVVIPIQVPGLDGVDGEVLEHRPGDVAEDRHVGADGHHALRIEQGGVEVLLLADEGGDGGAFQQRLHLRLGGAYGAADDLKRHRVAGSHGVAP